MTIAVGLVPCCNEVLVGANCEQKPVLSVFVEFGYLTYCCDLTDSELLFFDELVSLPVYGQAPVVLESLIKVVAVEAESKASRGRESPLVKRLALGWFVLNTFAAG